MFRQLRNLHIGWLIGCMILPGPASFTLQAQAFHYEFEDLPLPREMSGTEGVNAFQDSDGFMWFGSRQGLFRYDGSNIRQYSVLPGETVPEPGGQRGLLSDFTWSFLEDEDGILWFTNYIALTSFDREREIFRHFQDPGLLPWVEGLMEDSEGFLWVGSETGLSRFDRETGTFTHYPAYMPGQEGKVRNPVWSVYEDSEGVFWVIFYNYGMAIFDREKGTFENIDPIPAPVENIIEDRSGRILVATQKGLYVYDRDSNTFTRQLYRTGDPNRLDSDHLQTIIPDGSGHLWINSMYGIYVYSENLERLNYFTILDADQPEMMGNMPNGPRYMYVDRQGTLWFFYRKKIGRLVKQFDNFTVYEPAEDRRLEGEVMANGDHIFITNLPAPLSSCFMIDRKNHTYSRIDIDPGSEIRDYGYSLKDRSGNLWIATLGQGLYRGSAGKEGLIRFEKVLSNPPDSSGVLDLNLSSLYEDSNGRIWLEVKGRQPCFYDPELDRIQHLVNNPRSRDELPINTSDDFGLGVVYGETNNGILLVSYKASGIFAIIPPFISVSEHAVMPSNVIRFRPASGDGVIKGWNMYQSAGDSTGVIWTTGAKQEAFGFQKLIPADAKKSMDFRYTSRIYSVRDGLPNSLVNCFIEDNKGDFWLGTIAQGIVKFDPDRETFSNYTTNNGLPGVHMNRFVKDESGEIYVSPENGSIFSFRPDSFLNNTHVPPVFITDLKINQQSVSPWDSTVLEKQICYTKQVGLTYRQNNLSFSFAALDYIDPSRNQYKYRLEGFDKDWILGGNRTSVDYTNLDPGKYRFRVIGSNNEGTWNDTGAVLDIKITPPPWKTAWAYLIYAILLAGIILAYRRFLINRAKIRATLEIEHLEKEKLQEIDRMKSRFFANVSHEFRTPLTLLLGPIEDVLKSNTGKAQFPRDLIRIMHRNALRLQHLINQLLDISRLEMGKVGLQVTEGVLEETAEIIILSFLSLAERKKIRYTYSLPGSYLNVFFDRDKFEKILTNLVSNAFKFTPEGGTVSVSLGFTLHEQTGRPVRACLEVSDTGKGIPGDQIDRIFDRFYQVDDGMNREQEGSGIGLALTKELAELCHGEIRVESEPGKGSRFTVSIPVSREAFQDGEITEGGKDSKDESIPKMPIGIPDEENHQEGSLGSTGPGYGKAALVLVVEDNDDLRSYICQNLGAAYRTMTAQNGKKGLELAIKHIPDLVISDVMMPGMDGIEMCRMLKQDERTDHIPVIMITARADQDSKMEGLETGADAYLVKPFDTSEMLVRIKHLIAQRNRMRDKFRKSFFPGSVEVAEPRDDPFLDKIINKLQESISEPEFTMEQLGRDLHMSRSQLYRKVGAIAGLSPHELLRMIRMKRAAQLLQSGELNVTQVMYQVGMRNTSNFSRSFHHYFGTNPSEYRYSARKS